MNKIVTAAIESAKMSIRGGRLPEDGWRLLLHNALEKYHAFAINENKDFYTHEVDADLTYVAARLGYELAVPIFGGAAATGALNLNAPITENETIEVGGIEFTFVTDPVIRTQVQYSDDLEDTAENFSDAINAAFSTVTASFLGTSVLILYNSVGTIGNTFSLVNSSLSAVEATAMSGGLDTIESRDYTPIALLHQDSSADEETDVWERIKIVKYNHFLEDNVRGPMAAFIGNEWQGLHNAILKLNLTSDWVSSRRFRFAFRYFPQTLLDWTATIPFPAEFTQLLELSMAREALDICEDNSPDWDKFYMRRVQTLEKRLKETELQFVDWLSTDAVNILLTDRPYDHRYNNPLRTDRPMRLKVEW